jgi:hypothetical protein
MPGGEFPCEADDISRFGALLTGPIPPCTAGERLDLTLRAPVGTLELSATVCVVRHAPLPEGSDASLAIEFVDLSDEQRSVLEALVARIMEGFAPAPLEGLRPGSPPSEVRKALEAVPLAHRIALAARAGLREREFLRQDTHPAVLEGLARNPNLLPAEAHALAASPHILPSTLEIFLADARWAKDDDLRGLIAIHPRVPLAFAERALAGLKPPALRKLLQAPSLNAAVREKILRRMQRGA